MTTRRIPLQDFYTKRFFRIAPMFYAALLFYLSFDWINASIGILTSYPDVTLALFLSTLAFSNVLHPEWLFSLVPGGWSISNELLFYLCVPLLFKLVKTIRQGVVWTVATLMLSIVLHRLTEQSQPFFGCEELFILLVPKPITNLPNGDYLISGMARQHMVHSFLSHDDHRSISLLIFLSVTPFDVYSVFLKHALFSLAFCLFALGLSGIPGRILSHRVMQYIGQISFSLYLVHFFVLDVVKHYMKGEWVQQYGTATMWM